MHPGRRRDSRLSPRLSRDPAARRRFYALVGAAAIALVVGLLVGAGSGGEESGPASSQPGREESLQHAVDRLGLREQVGQVLISSFDETSVPEYIHRRLRARETAGVILFGRNAESESQWRELTRSLQRQASNEALVMVDQEGGPVRTVSFAGPEAAQPFQGAPAEIRSAARDAGETLRSIGVNVNLAPVADLAAPGGAMASRAFAGDAATVAASTRASIAGMRAGGVAATAKHFPGLGASPVNTDDASATVTTARSILEDAELVPFRAAVAEDVPLVMLSHALYPALDGERIASQSRPIVTGLLRGELGYDGVIVTDSLEAQAVLDRSGIAAAAERSVVAGADLILMTGSASWNEVFPRLLARARESAAFRRRVRESAARVLGLKRLLR
jgi:beta-N-acetylhexosaminidase